MDAKLTLYADLCALLTPDAPARQALWAALGRYQIASTAATISYPDSLTAFLAAKQVDGLSPKTIKEYRRILTAIGAGIGKPPAAIAADDIRTYLAALNDRLRPSSIQTYTNALRSFFSWLQAEGQIERNPMLKIKSRRLDRASTRKPLTARELERVRRSCQTPRERALLELMASTGCRVSEISNLRRSAINMQSRTLTVTGKGNKTRMVLFSARAEFALEEYLGNAPTGTYAFAGLNDRPLSTAAIQRAMHTVGVRAGLSEKLHPHRLRHTFASLALNRGMDLAILQQLMGHQSADTTEIYARLSPATIARAYARAVA